MSKAKKQSITTPAVKETPKAKPRNSKGARLCRKEWEAIHAQVYIGALNEVCCAHSAIDGLLHILDRGDEEDIATANLLRLPINVLGKAVKQFPNLEKATQKYRDAQIATHKYYYPGKEGGAK
jgi:hypothetical protein